MNYLYPPQKKKNLAPNSILKKQWYYTLVETRMELGA